MYVDMVTYSMYIYHARVYTCYIYTHVYIHICIYIYIANAHVEDLSQLCGLYLASLVRLLCSQLGA